MKKGSTLSRHPPFSRFPSITANLSVYLSQSRLSLQQVQPRHALDSHSLPLPPPPLDPPSSTPFHPFTLSSCSTETVQLLGRHWIIQDSRGVTVTEVPRGTRGVIGCTPIIKPGTCFQYYSGTDLDEAPGSMHGSFQMAVLDDRSQPLESFDAEVAPFHFWPPSTPA
ncbi:hypothetical protein ACKKBF_B37230 [Auxenochlorella protothecoides x Auxenochlorella symbiontica]